MAGHGKNIIEISTRRAAVRQALGGDGEVPLVDRLALVLADIVDEPLVTLPGKFQPGSGPGQPQARPGPQPLELRLAHFKPELAELAAGLLEEAGF